jgi:hypothetical protein
MHSAGDIDLWAIDNRADAVRGHLLGARRHPIMQEPEPNCSLPLLSIKLPVALIYDRKVLSRFGA